VTWGFAQDFPRDLSRRAFAPDEAGVIRGEGGSIDFVSMVRHGRKT
jgi:hypothetical protein